MHRFYLAGQLVGCNGSMLQDTGLCSIDGDLERMLLLEQMHSDVNQLEVCSRAPKPSPRDVSETHTVPGCAPPPAAVVCTRSSLLMAHRPRTLLLFLLQEMILTQLYEAEELLGVLRRAAASSGGVELLVVRFRRSLSLCLSLSLSLAHVFCLFFSYLAVMKSILVQYTVVKSILAAADTQRARGLHLDAARMWQAN